MNYGYDSTCSGWKPSRKRRLATELEGVIERGPYIDRHGMKPYIEVDRLYPGVRIRRITHLTDAQQERLIAEADAKFDEVMRDPGPQAHRRRGLSNLAAGLDREPFDPRDAAEPHSALDLGDEGVGL